MIRGALSTVASAISVWTQRTAASAPRRGANAWLRPLAMTSPPSLLLLLAIRAAVMLPAPHHVPAAQARRAALSLLAAGPAGGAKAAAGIPPDCCRDPSCTVDGFTLEQYWNGSVYANIPTAHSAEDCCDACSAVASQHCARWLFDGGTPPSCKLLSNAGASSPGRSSLISALRVALPPPPPPAGPPPALWFAQQTLDHFTPALQQGRWAQRFYVNDTLWGGPGFPVFLYIGGASAEDGASLSGKLFLSNLATMHQALTVAIEHRYFGESQPTGTNLSDRNLSRLLSSQQALADLANFVTWFKGTYGGVDGMDRSPWVCFGGGYGGSLSAWFRLKCAQHCS